MHLEIQTQHLALDPAVRDLIEQTAADIASGMP